MTIYGTVNKESIDQVHRNGLVKPNEYKAIRDSVILKEVNLRVTELSQKMDRFFDVILGKDLVEEFYLKETGYFDKESAVLDLVYNSPESLLLEQDDINLLILADVAYKKALKVRDLGDVNKSKHLLGEIFADKETFRSLDYLTKHKRGLWDLLGHLEDNIGNTEEE